MQELINRAKELLADGTVARVLGWKAGTCLTIRNRLTLRKRKTSRISFTTASAGRTKQIYDRGFQAGGQNPRMPEAVRYIQLSGTVERTPCDREKAYIIGVGCKGKLDIEKITRHGHQRYQKHLRRRDRR